MSYTHTNFYKPNKSIILTKIYLLFLHIDLKWLN